MSPTEAEAHAQLVDHEDCTEREQSERVDTLEHSNGDNLMDRENEEMMKTEQRHENNNTFIVDFIDTNKQPNKVDTSRVINISLLRQRNKPQLHTLGDMKLL